MRRRAENVEQKPGSGAKGEFGPPKITAGIALPDLLVLRGVCAVVSFRSSIPTAEAS